MATIIRSIQTNLGVFSAENNIRRNVGTFSTNYVTAAGNTTMSYQTLAPGGTFSVPPGSTSVLVVQVSGPVFADLTYASLTLNSTNRPAGTTRVVVNQVLHLDDSITGVVFTNPQSYSVRLTLIHG